MLMALLKIKENIDLNYQMHLTNSCLKKWIQPFLCLSCIHFIALIF